MFLQSQICLRQVFIFLLGADIWVSNPNRSDPDYYQTTRERCKNHRQTSQVNNGGASGHPFDQDVWLGSFLHPTD